MKRDELMSGLNRTISIVLLLAAFTFSGCAGGRRLLPGEYGNEETPERLMLVATGMFLAIPPDTPAETRLREKMRKGESIGQNELQPLLRDAHTKPVVRSFTRFIYDPSHLVSNEVKGTPAQNPNDFSWNMTPALDKDHLLRWDLKCSARSHDKSLDSAHDTSELEIDTEKYRIFGPVRQDGDHIYGFIMLHRMIPENEVESHVRTQGMNLASAHDSPPQENNRNTPATMATMDKTAIRIQGKLIALPRKAAASLFLPLFLRDASTLGEDTVNSLCLLPGARIILQPNMSLSSGGSGTFNILRSDGQNRIPLLECECHATLQPDGQVSLRTILMLDMKGSCELIDRRQIVQPDPGRYTFVGSCPQGQEDVYAFIAAEVVR